nr:hypothetical protein Iba_chr14fCG3070 [Ipomoea batatas]
MFHSRERMSSLSPLTTSSAIIVVPSSSSNETKKSRMSNAEPTKVSIAKAIMIVGHINDNKTENLKARTKTKGTESSQAQVIPHSFLQIIKAANVKQRSFQPREHRIRKRSCFFISRTPPRHVPRPLGIPPRFTNTNPTSRAALPLPNNHNPDLTITRTLKPSGKPRHITAARPRVLKQEIQPNSQRLPQRLHGLLLAGQGLPS